MSFFAKNIDSRGRMIRAAISAALFLAAVVVGIVRPDLWWIALILLANAFFGFYEAARGWCIMRACRIKTPF